MSTIEQVTENPAPVAPLVPVQEMFEQSDTRAVAKGIQLNLPESVHLDKAVIVDNTEQDEYRTTGTCITIRTTGTCITITLICRDLPKNILTMEQTRK